MEKIIMFVIMIVSLIKMAPMLTMSMTVIVILILILISILLWWQLLTPTTLSKFAH